MINTQWLKICLIGRLKMITIITEDLIKLLSKNTNKKNK
jgi:hypothetical protein